MPPLFLTNLLRSSIEPYQRVAWFLFEAGEREHLLNLQALWRSPFSPGWFTGRRGGNGGCRLAMTTGPDEP